MQNDSGPRRALAALLDEIYACGADNLERSLDADTDRAIRLAAEHAEQDANQIVLRQATVGQRDAVMFVAGYRIATGHLAAILGDTDRDDATALRDATRAVRRDAALASAEDAVWMVRRFTSVSYPFDAATAASAAVGLARADRTDAGRAGTLAHWRCASCTGLASTDGEAAECGPCGLTMQPFAPEG